MNIGKYFGMNPEKNWPHENREELIKQLNGLLLEASVKQKELAKIILENQQESNGEDARRFLRQIQEINNLIDSDLSKMDTGRLSNSIEELHRVINNIDRQITSYRKCS